MLFGVKWLLLLVVYCIVFTQPLVWSRTVSLMLMRWFTWRIYCSNESYQPPSSFAPIPYLDTKYRWAVYQKSEVRSWYLITRSSTRRILNRLASKNKLASWKQMLRRCNFDPPKSCYKTFTSHWPRYAVLFVDIVKVFDYSVNRDMILEILSQASMASPDISPMSSTRRCMQTSESNSRSTTQ